MEKPEKIGLVVEGGGMKCAYNAGILDAFMDNGISFDYCIGVSGGAETPLPLWRDSGGAISGFIRSIPIPPDFSDCAVCCGREICSV